MLFLIIDDLSLAIQLKRHLNYQLQPQHSESILSTALGFLKDKRMTDHYSIFAPEAIGFKEGAEQMAELSFIGL